MAYSNIPRKETLRSIADASPVPFWLDDPTRLLPEPELAENISTDLLIIGAGFTGLWTALLAKEENPSRDVLILEADEVASGGIGIRLSRWSVDQADRNQGRENLWLRAMDWLGLGFDR